MKSFKKSCFGTPKSFSEEKLHSGRDPEDLLKKFLHSGLAEFIPNLLSIQDVKRENYKIYLKIFKY